MTTDVKPFQSEWPYFLLMDEIWLKVRRLLVNKLEEEGYWQKIIFYRKFKENRLMLGNNISNHRLKQILGLSDYAYLYSESIFGNSNRYIIKKIPYVLAFGYDLGSLSHIIVNGQGNNHHDDDFSDITSVFNLGISLFDLVCDSEPQLLKKFNQIINEKVLYTILTDKAACINLQKQCDKIHSVELRLLIKIITWFFLRVHSIIAIPNKRSLRKKLYLCILSAYHAEIQSSLCSKNLEEKNINISKKKSTLPFTVIYLIVSLLESSDFLNLKGRKDNASGYIIIKKIGEIFWLIDDLLDIVKDIEFDNLNFLLIKTNKNVSSQQSDRHYRILMELLTGKHIEKVINQICFNLNFIFNSLKTNGYEQKDIEMIRNLISFYIRKWIQ